MPDIYIGETPKKPELIKEDSQSVSKAEPSAEVTSEDPENINESQMEKIASSISSPLIEEVTKKPHFFASYCVRPNGIRLAEKSEREELLLFLRKHFVTNFPWIIITLLASLVPILILISLSLRIFTINLFPERYGLIIIIFYYFFIFSGYMFVSFLTWFYNISVVTSERVVDIDFSNLVFENVAATKLTQVEDVSYAQIGIIRSLFDYGDVKLQTAGSSPEFEFDAVPHPEKIIKIINNLIGEKE